MSDLTGKMTISTRRLYELAPKSVISLKFKVTSYTSTILAAISVVLFSIDFMLKDATNVNVSVTTFQIALQRNTHVAIVPWIISR